MSAEEGEFFSISELRELEAEERERQARLDAERCTLEFRTKSQRTLDSGELPIEESPLFGGPRQKGMFD